MAQTSAGRLGEGRGGGGECVHVEAAAREALAGTKPQTQARWWIKHKKSGQVKLGADCKSGSEARGSGRGA
jgi:hypothetical protein